MLIADRFRFRETFVRQNRTSVPRATKMRSPERSAVGWEKGRSGRGGGHPAMRLPVTHGHGMECAPRGGRNGRFELTPPCWASGGWKP